LEIICYICIMLATENTCQNNHEVSLVSVVLCTYNGAKYLREQLDSLIAQTYPLHEIIIQDDGSTDNTLQIATEYADKHEMIHIYSNTREHGINNNFFSAFQKATGEYIAVCDQDDIWEPDKLSCQIKAITQTDKLLCFCHSKPFSDDGSFFHYDGRIPNFNLYRLLFNNEVPGHTILMHRSLLDKLPKHEDCPVMYQKRMYDIILALTAAAYDSIAFVDKILVHYRRYQSAATYSSYSGSLPTMSNAFHILIWSISHYSEMKTLTADRYSVQMDFLSHLKQPASICHGGIEMMKLLISRRLGDLLKSTGMCLRHRFEIFHSRGKDPENIVRALLFPFTSLYYCRFLLNRSNK